MKRALIILAFAIVVASCAGGQAPVTNIGNDLAGACIVDKAEYDGYRDCCDIRRTCTQRKQADDIRAVTRSVCARADTSENISLVRANTTKIAALECRR
jgi:hypothetical protein